MDESGKGWFAIIKDLPILRVVINLSAGQLLTLAALGFTLYVGGSGAYILGVVVGLPWSVATLINHATIVHLTGQLTFMVLIILALFKVANLFSTGALIQWNFMVCKFGLGPKRPRGLRDPAVSRLQRQMNNALVEGRSHMRIALGMRIVIVFAFCLFTFFKIETSSVTTTLQTLVIYSMIIFCGVIGFLGSMAAYRVAEKKTHKEFVSTPEGRRLAVVTILFVCMILGMARTFTMMHGPVVYFSSERGVCQLAPMMPVYGGDLYFEREDSNFVVISSNRIAFYIPRLPSLAEPACI